MWTNPRRWMPENLVDLYDHARFELRTTWGRMRAKRYYEVSGIQYLHLGCGEKLLEGFLNTDSFGNPHAQVHVDVRFPLPFAENSWKGIYAHHLLEHVDEKHAQALFRECQRILRSNGILHIAVPDAEKFVRAYSLPEGERQKMFQWYPSQAMEQYGIETPMQMVNLVFRAHKFNRHEFAWDFETMEKALLSAGFQTVVRGKCNQSADPWLAGHDAPDWEDHSLYVEASK
ncbi:MAG: methyltransferase domain-containing protein [Bryobacteraceae bacterium]